MLPTPSTSHVNYEQIYEPAEDSYLLLDTLSSEAEKEFLQSHFPKTTNAPLLVEVGTGSGVVLAFATANASHLFGRTDIATLGLDVNDFACSATSQTVKCATQEAGVDQGGRFLGAVCGDLTTPLREGCVDILIFNPPYVPTEELPKHPKKEYSDQNKKWTSTESFERDSHLLSLSYAGGVDGMETTNRLLGQLPQVLSDRGVAYVLFCAQNKPDEVASRIRRWPVESKEKPWQTEIVGRSGNKAGWERLCIMRIWRT
ncbi:uncharacterized protein MYCFIDRAFT_45813 [Pseudocercospora fijiensis CIRAD86]|uniref:Methyltransferase small domain-containing protein n=1 Tax=Pseudocercospora fijiensis (strain CIRAD86) TaxID=383855 RepID=M3A008_PSEFD|nr:uncharacterized protein MYCFIDRAFT_45813 [Pseudocercospora fijiensis CIRAD86]EME77736.1 hypothetical protein MYCFIDRAFT_45813 [Pseudocercospora fijiensis CIRAD86]